MITSIENKLRSSAALGRLISFLSVIIICFGCMIMWQTANRPESKYRGGLDRLAGKIGQTYTSEMHQKISKIIKDGDEVIFSFFDVFDTGGRLMVMFGLILLIASVTNVYFLKKVIRETKLAEKGCADEPAIAPQSKPSNNLTTNPESKSRPQ